MSALGARNTNSSPCTGHTIARSPSPTPSRSKKIHPPLFEEEIIESVAEAFGEWQSVSCSDISFVRVPDSLNRVVLLTDGWRTHHDKEAVGLTSVVYNVETGVISSAVIWLNDETERLVDVDQSCDDAYDLRAVATHEIGHLLGFAHPCEYEEDAMVPRCEVYLQRLGGGELPTMFPRMSRCDAALRTLSADDIEALCTIYATNAPARACYAPAEPPRLDNTAFGCSVTPGSASITMFGSLLLIFGFLRASPR